MYKVYRVVLSLATKEKTIDVLGGYGHTNVCVCVFERALEQTIPYCVHNTDIAVPPPGYSLSTLLNATECSVPKHKPMPNAPICNGEFCYYVTESRWYNKHQRLLNMPCLLSATIFRVGAFLHLAWLGLTKYVVVAFL